MRYLYIFPHPDDESFGPALAISKQRRQGDEVHLLTLTRGGATRVRHELGLTIEQMGELRYQEMLEVEKVLDLTSMEVLDLPDGQLAALDPIELEEIVTARIERLQPDVVVSYPVHGISGFPDHLVMHAVVKRAVSALKRSGAQLPRRLAFMTLLPSDQPDTLFPLKTSKPEDVDCGITIDAEDREAAENALACYRTYAETIRQADPLTRVGSTVYFEIFGESFDPRLEDLGEQL
jgi:N-acetylglucosamine malate deacetylase 2